MLVLGMIAGFLTSVIMKTLTKSSNQNQVVDSQGYIYSIVIVAFIGSFVVFPLILAAHSGSGANYFALGGFPEVQYTTAAFQLAYAGVTVLIAIIGGLIGGCLLKATV